jgi:predicted regulator of Ras-like GTPase activity (Roadblock/LC7/MglB family)
MRSACLRRRTPILPNRRNNANGGVQSSMHAKFRDIVAKLRMSVIDIQAVILVGPQGVIDHILDDTSLNLETIAGEYSTLLHIARSASEDSGSGNLVENIVVSEKSVMIARTIAPEHYLILLARTQDQIGRARYELKQAAWEIQR